MNLQWGYNYVWIKEGDEQKVVFTIPEESFELTVIFFGLANLLATFQTIINKILWYFINIGKVVDFIDDVLIGMDTEKEYEEIVEEVVRRLAENNLYIKPEKC